MPFAQRLAGVRLRKTAKFLFPIFKNSALRWQLRAMGLGLLASTAISIPALAATLYLSPSTDTVAQNDLFPVDIRVNSGVDSVNAIQANVSYPADKLEVVSLSYTGSVFTVKAEETRSAGLVRFARATAGGLPASTGDKLFATILFKAKLASGSAAVSFAAGSSVIRSTDHANVLTGTTGGTYTLTAPDTAKPTVSVTQPVNGASVSGTAVTVSGTATDNIGVVGVQFKLDGANLGAEDATAPYSITWNTTLTPNGSHTLTAVARDAAGNKSTSTVVNVVVSNPVPDTTPPSVSLTAPANGSTVSGAAVTVSGTATDNVGVAGVQFKLDGANLGAEDTTAPYSITWNTTLTPNGSHTLTAVARDAAGNKSTSTVVTVTVSNGVLDTIKPTKPTGLAAVAASPTQVNLSWNASTDNVGVTGYRVFRNGVLLATVAAINYQDVTVIANTGYTYTVLAQDAAGNLSDLSDAVTVTTPPLVIDKPNPTDTQAPTAPQTLKSKQMSGQELAVTWAPSRDNVGVKGYYIFRNNAHIGTLDCAAAPCSNPVQYKDASISPPAVYAYTVSSYDAAGNISPRSAPTIVKTKAAKRQARGLRRFFRRFRF
jgi:chitodextrinase